MKYLLPAIALFLLACNKDADTPTPIGPGGSGGSGSTVTLGVQKGIFASNHHDFNFGMFEANDKRLLFTAHNSTTTYDDIYAGDTNDSIYLLTHYNNDPYYLALHLGKLCLKPNGEIISISRKPNSTGTDSIVILVNKPNTNYWQLVKKEIYSSFWNTYFQNGYNLFMNTTSTGRLVMTGAANTKVAVSDDNGLTWHQTFTLPVTYLNYTGHSRNSFSGSRSFIISGNMILYSDNDFETGNLVIINQFGNTHNKILKLDDQRLVMQYSTPGRIFYQSFNNGQSWSVMPLMDPVDSLSTFSNSYFCFAGGTKIRTRARYTPCNSYYTLDIDPLSKFIFYPNTRPTCPLPTSSDNVIMSSQRADKRMYYVMIAPIGVSTYLILNRDY